MGSSYAGADWLCRQLQYQNRTVGAFGRRVADLLGDVLLGIYHEDKAVTNRKIDWASEHCIDVTFYSSGGRWASYDGSLLTRLVILCHDRAVRVEVHAATHNFIKFRFYPRNAGSTDYSTGHPSIEQAIHKVRASCPPARP